MKTDQQLIFESSKTLKKTLKLPFSLSSMLLTFQNLILQNSLSPSSSNQFFEGSSQLYTAFSSLLRKQRIRHYSFCIQFLSTLLSSPTLTYPRAKLEPPLLSITCYRKTGLLSFSEKTHIIVDNQNKKLTLVSSGKKEDKINLRNYLLRESKDHKKHCLIFESVVKYQYKTTIRLYFEERSFGESKMILRRLADEVEREKLYEEVVRGMKSNPMGTPETSNSLSTPETCYLNRENLRVFYNLFETLKENEQETGNVERLSILNSSYKNITTNGNDYYLQELFNLKQEEMIRVITSKDHEWNSLCVESVLVEVSKGERVFTERFLFEGVRYAVTYLMSKKEDENGRFLIKSVKSEKKEGEQFLDIEFIYINLKKITEDTTQLLIKAKMDTRDGNRVNFIIEFLKQFENIYQALLKLKETLPPLPFSTLNNIPPPEQTVYFDAKGEEEILPPEFTHPDDSIYSIEKYFLNPPSTEADLTSSINFTSENTDTQEDLQCLKFKHVLYPIQKAEVKKLKEHYLDAEWVRDKEGGLLCINERILSEQKKVLKHVFSSFGKNLFSNKSIMNISLPASVCTKFSHLKMIANNFVYAPLLIESACSLPPLERMKRMVAFLITIGNTGISSEKPFNPILGETFEGIINGCPIYLEQISHHPPTSAYVFEGRGYSISGTIEPKVEATGINSVRCYSDKENRLVFDDGSVVYMSYPKIALKGLLYGSRYFNFEGKNFIFDEKNLLFADITFGQEKVSYIGNSKDPIDTVFGKVYKVRESLVGLWKGGKRKEIVLKDHVEKEVAEFKGTWTQALRFDGEEYFNFRSEMPCVLEEKGCPLPSDSQFRTDIRKLIENNVGEAQVEKERLEDLQRKDKAMREKHRNKGRK